MNGLSQGCGWPAEAKLLRQWFHPDMLGTVWSIGSASSNVAGSVIPALLPVLLPIAGGWRPFMMGTGGECFIALAFFFIHVCVVLCFLGNIICWFIKKTREFGGVDL